MLPLYKPENLNQVTAWKGNIKVWGRHTYGIAGERFFRELKDSGKLFGTRCQECRVTYIPARIYCERCFSGLTDWIELPNRGTVGTFTISHYSLDGTLLKTPDALGLITFEGAEGGLVHRLRQVEPHDIYIGMPVQMVLKSKAQRQGSILDIRYFRPLRPRTKR